MHLVKIFALFLLVKSSRYEVQELLKNDCHILLHYDDEQIGHISIEIAPLFDTKGLTAFQNDLLCDELALLKFWKYSFLDYSFLEL